jgi:hypothetical protein
LPSCIAIFFGAAAFAVLPTFAQKQSPALRAVALLAALFCTPVAAENLYSFSAALSYPSLRCDGSDQWLNIKTEISGAGIFPKSPVVIVGTQLWSFFAYPHEYLMIGATQPNGDAVSPYVFGTSNFPPTFFPAGLGFAFDPIGMNCTSTIPVYQLIRTHPLGLRYFTRMACTVSTDTHRRPIAAQY